MSSYRTRLTAALSDFRASSERRARRDRAAHAPYKTSTQSTLSSVESAEEQSLVESAPVNLLHIRTALHGNDLDSSCQLVFETPPHPSHPSIHQFPGAVPVLMPSPANDHILNLVSVLRAHETALMRALASPHPPDAPTLRSVLTSVSTRLRDIDVFLRSIWERDRLVQLFKRVVHTGMRVIRRF